MYTYKVILANLVEQSVCNFALHPHGTKTEVVPQRTQGGLLQHHTERLETHPYQRDHSGMVQLAHNRQLLSEVLVAVEEDISVVLLPKDLHSYRLPVIGTSVHLRVYVCMRIENGKSIPFGMGMGMGIGNNVCSLIGERIGGNMTLQKYVS